MIVRNASGPYSGVDFPSMGMQRRLRIHVGPVRDVRKGLAEYLGVSDRIFYFCTANQVLRDDETFPLTDDVFLVAACFVDDKNLDRGEWRQMVGNTITAMSNGKWEEARHKVRALRKDMVDVGLGDVNIQKLSTCPSGVYVTLVDGDTFQVLDLTPSPPSPMTLSFRMGTDGPTVQIRFVVLAWLLAWLLAWW